MSELPIDAFVFTIGVREAARLAADGAIAVSDDERRTIVDVVASTLEPSPERAPEGRPDLGGLVADLSRLASAVRVYDTLAATLAPPSLELVEAEARSAVEKRGMTYRSPATSFPPPLRGVED